MFLVERNGSNPFSLSALENTLFSVQIVFRRKMVVGVEVVEFLPKVCLTYAGSEEMSFCICGHRKFLYTTGNLLYILFFFT